MAGGNDEMKTDKQAEGILANMSKKDRIFMACDGLVRDGHKVTEAIVLSMVGGSPSTVHRYVKEWKDLARLRERAPAVPTAFLESLNALFLTLNEQAKEQAKAREKELEDEIAALEDESKIAEEELERRDKKEAELTDANSRLTTRVTELEAELGTANVAHSESETKRAVLEEKVNELQEDLRQRDVSATKTLADLKEQHRSELDRLQEVYERSENRLFQQLADVEDRYKAQIHELKKEADDRADTIRHEAQEEVARVRRESQNTVDRYETSFGELNTAMERLKGLLAKSEDEHKAQNEGYQLVADAFAELFGIDVDMQLADPKALQKSIRDAKKQFYSSSSE